MVKNNKGFTLVELLAVIIILAIVVGITIPAVLTTTNKTKQKALETAAGSVADWVDRQYQVYKMGVEAAGVATLDPIFEKLCVRECYSTSNCSGQQLTIIKNNGSEQNMVDYFNANDIDDSGKSNKCDCNCDNRLTFLTREFISAAGLNQKNIKYNENNWNGYRVQKVSGIRTVIDSTTSNSYTLPTAFQNISKVYINPETGRSCVTLQAASDGDYPQDAVACGGVCQSDYVTRPDYCLPTS